MRTVNFGAKQALSDSLFPALFHRHPPATDPGSNQQCSSRSTVKCPGIARQPKPGDARPPTRVATGSLMTRPI